MPSLQSLRARSTGLPGAALAAILSGTLAAPANALQNPPVPTAVPVALGEPEAVASPPLNTDQLEALVAPIALYPDPLLAQCLVASTYPLDLVAAQQWRDRNPSLKGADLEAAAEQQPWDPSVQALVAIPDAGHFTFLEQPDAFVGAMRTFVDRLDHETDGIRAAPRARG